MLDGALHRPMKDFRDLWNIFCMTTHEAVLVACYGTTSQFHSPFCLLFIILEKLLWVWTIFYFIDFLWPSHPSLNHLWAGVTTTLQIPATLCWNVWGIQECSWECSGLQQQLHCSVMLDLMRSLSLLKVAMHMHSSSYVCEYILHVLHMGLCDHSRVVTGRIDSDEMGFNTLNPCWSLYWNMTRCLLGPSQINS